MAFFGSGAFFFSASIHSAHKGSRSCTDHRKSPSVDLSTGPGINCPRHTVMVACRICRAAAGVSNSDDSGDFFRQWRVIDGHRLADVRFSSIRSSIRSSPSSLSGSHNPTSTALRRMVSMRGWLAFTSTRPPPSPSGAHAPFVGQKAGTFPRAGSAGHNAKAERNGSRSGSSMEPRATEVASLMPSSWAQASPAGASPPSPAPAAEALALRARAAFMNMSSALLAGIPTSDIARADIHDVVAPMVTRKYTRVDFRRCTGYSSSPGRPG